MSENIEAEETFLVTIDDTKNVWTHVLPLCTFHWEEQGADMTIVLPYHIGMPMSNYGGPLKIGICFTDDPYPCEAGGYGNYGTTSLYYALVHCTIEHKGGNSLLHGKRSDLFSELVRGER